MDRKVFFCICIFLIITVCAGASSVYVIPIKGEIDPALTVFLRRSIEKAETETTELIIFEIDTFGGRVDSALQIANLIGNIRALPTVAYVSTSGMSTGVSWSAGALISFACDFIYMAPGTSMGAAAPIRQTSEGTEFADEKTVSAVRAQMASLAEKNGYPPGVARAMVDFDVVLYEAYSENGTVTVVTAEDAERREDELTLGPVISGEGKLLTLTAKEAVRYGVAAQVTENIDGILQDLGSGEGELIRLEPSAADRAVAFISSAAVTSLLLMIGLIALYMEITTPGFGIPGVAAILAFSTMFISGNLLGMVGSLELLLFLLGIAMIVVEIFLIPGFGVTGIGGLIFIGSALLLSQQDFVFPKFDWQWDIFSQNALTVGLGAAGSFIVIALLIVFLPHFSPFRKLVLESPSSGGSSDTSSGGDSLQDRRNVTADTIIGKQGITLTALRPAGKAEIEGEIIPVEADGEFLEAGQQVVVTDISGNRVKVVKGDNE